MKNYSEAEEIFKKIKSANKIILSLHLSPDPDCTGSNLALMYALKSLGKETILVSSDKPSSRLSYLPGFSDIIIDDLASRNLKDYDLFIAVDSGALSQISRSIINFPDTLPIINIDHHYTNPKYGQINLVDGEIGSCGELLFNLFKEWKIDITPDIATCLFSAIAGDTGMFKHANAVTSKTFKAGEELLERGAKLDLIVLNLFQRVPFQAMKFWGFVLSKMELIKAKKFQFVWCAISFEDLQKFSDIDSSSGASDMFMSICEGTDIGIMITEREKGIVRGSIRSRTGLDVGELTAILGGGGHKAAAGFRFDLQGKSFRDGTNELLQNITEILDSQF